MRTLLQRVTRAAVTVEGAVIGSIGPGLLVLAAAGKDDGAAQVELLARKIAELRIFADTEGKFNRSLLESGGAILLVSQFTLYADCRRGRRPSFSDAAPGPQAQALIEQLEAALRGKGIEVQSGIFGAMMQVELVNDGPVTIWLDTDEL